MFKDASLQDFFDSVIAFPRSPGPGSISVTVTNSSVLDMSASSSGRLATTDRGPAGVEIFCGVNDIVDAKYSGGVRIPDLRTAMEQYAAGGRFKLPKNLSVFVPPQVRENVPQSAADELLFLEFVHKTYGEFALRNPSIIALNFAFKNFSKVSVAISTDKEEYIFPHLRNFKMQYQRDYELDFDLRKPIYEGSNGRPGQPGTIWFSLQVSPFSNRVSSRLITERSISYSHVKGHRLVETVFPLDVNYNRYFSKSIHGFEKDIGYFVLSNVEFEQVDYCGKTLLGSTPHWGRFNNNELMTISGPGNYVVNYEGNITVRNNCSDQKIGSVTFKNYNDPVCLDYDSSLIYISKKKDYRYISDGIGDYQKYVQCDFSGHTYHYYLLKNRIPLLEGQNWLSAPVYAFSDHTFSKTRLYCFSEIWVVVLGPKIIKTSGVFHTFLTNAKHDDDILNANFGSLFYRDSKQLVSEKDNIEFCTGRHSAPITSPVFLNDVNPWKVYDHCSAGTALVVGDLLVPTEMLDTEFKSGSEIINLSELLQRSRISPVLVDFISPEMAGILRSSDKIVKRIRIRDKLKFWVCSCPGPGPSVDGKRPLTISDCSLLYGNEKTWSEIVAVISSTTIPRFYLDGFSPTEEVFNGQKCNLFEEVKRRIAGTFNF